MASTWPASLPDALLLGLRDSPQTQTIRTATGVGPAKVRRRATAVPRTIEGDLLLTGAQRQSLENFHDTTLSGVDPFTWTDPGDDSSITLRFVVRPTYVLEVGHDDDQQRLWRTRLQLEVMP